MLLLAVLLAALPQRFVSDVALQPRTYASASGEWTLHVDPSARDGAGKSTVTLRKQGELQWTGEKPFTFRDAVVDDAGICAGYGYTRGVEGDSESVGAIVVAVVGPAGETLLVDETPRESYDSSHMQPQPVVKQLILQRVLRSAVLRIGHGFEDERWFVYQLSPAKALDPVPADREVIQEDWGNLASLHIAAVEGTPLTLAQWHTTTKIDGGHARGSTWALYDERWRRVWSLPVPGDLHSAEGDAEWEAFRVAHDGGGLLQMAERRFELRHFAARERVTYAVEPDPRAQTGWSVRELARAPFAPVPVAEPATVPLLKLPLAGTVVLDVPVRAPGPVRDIEAFAIDAQGRITFVRGEPEGHAVALVTLDPTGAVLGQVAVAPIEPALEGTRAWHPLLDGAWLMTVSPWMGEQPESRAWRVDGRTGAAAELAELRGPEVEQVVPTSDGGFVLLGTHSLEHTMQGEVRRCSKAGATVWSRREQGYGLCEDAEEICSPEGIAVRADGAVLVLDGSRKIVQEFDAGGRFARTIDLKAAWDWESSYLTGLMLAADGSLWIGDHADEHCLRRVDASGKQVEVLVGRGLPHCFDARGSMWSHDGRQFLEWEAAGVLHRRFGTEADPARLDEPGTMLFDGSGRIAIEDARTGAVHVFRSDGRRAFVCVPGTGSEGGSLDAAIAAPDGRLYVQSNSFEDAYAAFGEDGKPAGAVQLGGERVAFDLRSKARWTAGEVEIEGEPRALRVRRFEADGRLGLELERRPDGAFFESLQALDVGPDGSVATLDALAHSPTQWRASVSLFGSKGEPRRVIEFDADDIEFARHLDLGRRWIVVSYSPLAYLISLPEGKVARFDVGGPEQESTLRALALSPDEQELWVLHCSPPRMLRYALPE